MRAQQTCTLIRVRRPPITDINRSGHPVGIGTGLTDILSATLTVIGLAMFEIVSSVDNAVVNADVLAFMSARARRFFLTGGMLLSVFLVRAGLPILIVYSIKPDVGIGGLFAALITEDPTISQGIESAAPPLLAAGGVFLLFLFLHWLFMEPKHYGLRGEEYIQRKGVWFFAVVSVLLTSLIWYSMQVNSAITFGASVGSSMFFITHGFRQSAEEREKQMLSDQKMSDWSKILYLEVIDASFSTDGVLGAFAFTLSVPLIIIGTAIGAIAVRQLTARNVENVKKYQYLKNGAMYSIAFLGCIMLAQAFGVRTPEWITPVATVAILGYFLYRSWRAMKPRSEA